jgi:hypothetical protein
MTRFVLHRVRPQVDLEKKPCPPSTKPDGCGGCKWAWKAELNARSVAVFFKDPTQISRISIKQIKNPGIIVVRTPSWPRLKLAADRLRGREVAGRG